MRGWVRRRLGGNPLALGFLDAAEAAELQALCDLNPQATGEARAICDALSGGLDPCGVGREHGGNVACSADGHLTNL